MALLFVAGVMNLLWIGLLATLVAAEKLLQWGHHVAQAVGAGLILAGAAVIV